VTDKLRPTYLIKEIKQLIRDDKIIDPPIKVKTTTNAMCLTIFEAYLEILDLEPRDYYKSMPDYFNNKVWWDVYKKKVKGMTVYIKFKITKDRFLLTSFKPDGSV